MCTAVVTFTGDRDIHAGMQIYIPQSRTRAVDSIRIACLLRVQPVSSSRRHPHAAPFVIVTNYKAFVAG